VTANQVGGYYAVKIETGCLQIELKRCYVHHSGAGDTVIAAMAVVMSAGGSAEEAATIANQAAGIVCGEVGIVPVDKHVLFQKLAEEVT
jgi:bifunctional ADP-heptose synthase (sugar kinase/adenylyltransferase)